MLNKLPPLPAVLKIDSFLCLLTGIAFTIFAQPLAQLIAPQLTEIWGFDLVTEFRIFGIGIIGIAAAVYFIAKRNPIPKAAIWTVIALDLIWIIDSLILLAQAHDVLTFFGKFLIAEGAIVVLLLTALEILSLSKSNQQIQSM